VSASVGVSAFGLILFESIGGFPVFLISLSPFEVIEQVGCRGRPPIPSEAGEYMARLIRPC
jgi:hypothetical protein